MMSSPQPDRAPGRHVSKVPKASPSFDAIAVRIGASVESSAKLQISCAPIGGESGRDARHRVGDVVMAAGRMVDAVATTARGAPLERAELADELRVVEQIDTAAVQRGQQVDIEITLRPRRLLETDVETAEHIDGPLARIAVTDDLITIVGAQER